MGRPGAWRPAISLLGCLVCTFVLFAGWVMAHEMVFAISPVSMMISLGISFREVQLSTKALELELSTVEDRGRAG